MNVGEIWRPLGFGPTYGALAAHDARPEERFWLCHRYVLVET